MPALQGLTRLQLREAVGYNTRLMELITAAANGSTTTFLSDFLRGAADEHNGKWWIGTDSPNAGVYSNVSDSAITTGRTTLTLYPAVTSTLSGDTAELWDMKCNPKVIEQFINNAITEITGLVYDPEESLALHGDGRQRRFDIPSEFVMVNGIYQRVAVESVIIHDAATAWDEAAAPSGVTRSVDTQDYKKAGGSNKFVIGVFTTGVVSSKVISSLDISKYDYVEFWVKSTIATVAGDFTLLLDDTALVTSALETLSIPALVADTWTYVRVALANPELDTAIISVGLNAANQISSNTIWINDVKAVLDSTAEWVKMENRNWRIDQEARDVVMFFAPPYQLLKLTGGDKPLLLTADSDVNEVDDQYVIARATELTLLAVGGGPGTDLDALRALAGYWGSKAAEAKRSLPLQIGNRVVG